MRPDGTLPPGALRHPRVRARGLALRSGACGPRPRRGVQLSIRPWAITAVALCIDGVTASRLGTAAGIDVLSSVGPFLAQATGLWRLGRWAHSDPLIVVSLLMVAGSGVIGALASGDLAVTLQFALYGALWLTAGCFVTMRPPPA